MVSQGTIMRNTSIDDLTQRIKIVYYNNYRDEYGNIVPSDERVRCECWAKVLPYGSKIFNGYAETVNEIDYRVVIRYRDDIKPTDRIIWRNKVLEIISSPYDAESRSKWLAMECRELIED